MSGDSTLVLGGTSDLGLVLIRRLASQAGPPIVAHGHASLDRLESLSAAHPGRLNIERADLSDPGEVDAFIAAIQKSHGLPGAIVHFAALPLRLERFSKWDQARFERDLAIQVSSLVRILGCFLPEMARRSEISRVIFVLSSVAVGVPPKYMSMYTVVKYAQLGLMRSLASEYVGTGIRVNAISPSMVESRFLAEIPPLAAEKHAAQTPQRRNLRPDDVLEPLMFLLGPGADHLSGVNIPMADGAVF